MPKQFDIVQNLDPGSRGAYPCLIILQSDRADSVATIVAPPLAASAPKRANPRLHPSIEVGGRRHVAFVTQLAAIPKNQLGGVVGSAAAHRYEIAALDMLFTGI